MDLQTIKKHLRLTFDYDDDLLNEYIDWAEEEIRNTVSISEHRDNTYFIENPTYDRAVTLLVTHFYENRKPTTDRPQYNLIYGSKSAIFKLKTHYTGDLDEL